MSATFQAETGPGYVGPAPRRILSAREQRAEAPTVAGKRVLVRVRCNECGRRWSVSPNAPTPQCSRCNSVDVEVRS